MLTEIRSDRIVELLFVTSVGGKFNGLYCEEPLSLQKLVTAAFASYIRIFFKNGIFAINIAAQNEITTVRLISKLRS